ncbi:MAG: hypothetical protein ACRYFS_09305 [Janthinobacterium lividum]
MTTAEQALPREEMARRADEIYETCIASHMTGKEPQWYVLIDLKTGAYEVDAREIDASDRLIARYPEAQVWMRRVGSRHARHFGWRGQFIEHGGPVR